MCKVLGKEVKIVDADEETAVKSMTGAGVPEALAKQLVARNWSEGGEGTRTPCTGEVMAEEGSANVPKYIGHATSLEEWAQNNQDIFS